MSGLYQAIAAAREAILCNQHGEDVPVWILRDLLAALDAARGRAVWQVSLPKSPECWSDYDSETTANAVAKASGNKCREVRVVYLAPPAPPAALAVPADGAYFAGLDHTGRPIYRQVEKAQQPAAAVPAAPAPRVSAEDLDLVDAVLLHPETTTRPDQWEAWQRIRASLEVGQ